MHILKINNDKVRLIGSIKTIYYAFSTFSKLVMVFSIFNSKLAHTRSGNTLLPRPRRETFRLCEFMSANIELGRDSPGATAIDTTYQGI